MPNNPSAVREPDVVRRLFEMYYAGEGQREDNPYISSHWRQESQFLIALDGGEGEITPVTGPYWGCNWKGIRGRLANQLGIFLHWVSLPHKREILHLWPVAVRVCKNMGLDPTFTVFRQVCSLELLQRYLPDELRNRHLNVLVIGDGIGILAALFKAVFPRSTVALADIGKALLFQAYYLHRAHPSCACTLADQDTDMAGLDFVYCPTECLDNLKSLQFDIIVNINSMQEMNSHTIERYFSFIRSHASPYNLFYCCNRERKVLIGGEVSEFRSYPWLDGDQYLVDGSCPWQRFYFSRELGTNGPRFFGVRLPWVNFYDGNIVHRLARLATT